jgi:hypothetical protein
VLPDVREIPYYAYDRLYARERNRFCGLPGRRELVVPVAGGCPRPLRLLGGAAARAVTGAAASGRAGGRVHPGQPGEAKFDYVAMYAPTFTLGPGAVRGPPGARSVSWKCTTTIQQLGRPLGRSPSWSVWGNRADGRRDPRRGPDWLDVGARSIRRRCRTACSSATGSAPTHIRC